MISLFSQKLGFLSIFLLVIILLGLIVFLLIREINSRKLINEMSNLKSNRQYEYPYIDAFGNPMIATIQKITNYNPQIQGICNFISIQEAQYLLDHTERRKQRSKISTKNGKGEVNDARTSFSTCFLKAENKVIAAIEKRSSELLNIPLKNFEPLQVVTYSNNQEYKPHLDSFEKQADTVKMSGNRKFTLLCYLTDVPPERGGGTLFPKLGLLIQPKLGTAIVWENLNRDGTVNKKTLHAALPVINYYKAAINIWIREREYKK